MTIKQAIDQLAIEKKYIEKVLPEKAKEGDVTQLCLFVEAVNALANKLVKGTNIINKGLNKYECQNCKYIIHSNMIRQVADEEYSFIAKYCSGCGSKIASIDEIRRSEA
ncbi:MAG: hypothetical protein FWC41_00010 [Firmicutes bacterium]|nr:hypothetical protein [Bacillota bacterium]